MLETRLPAAETDPVRTLVEKYIVVVGPGLHLVYPVLPWLQAKTKTRLIQTHHRHGSFAAWLCSLKVTFAHVVDYLTHLRIH